MSAVDESLHPSGLLKEGVLAGEFSRRAARLPDFETESRALGVLAGEMATSPGTAPQKLVELVLELCRADLVGLSFLEPGGKSERFRWVAAAGPVAARLNSPEPQEVGPFGTALVRDAVLLFAVAGRHLPALRDLQPPMGESLLAPFYIDDRLVGTLWAISHDRGRKFDAEDARLLGSLARFAPAVYQLTLAREAAENGRRELERRVQEQMEALRQSEARLRRAIEIDTVGVLFFDGGGHISDANEAFLRMSGYRREDLAKGRLRWDAMTPPEWLPRSLEAIAELKTVGRTTPYQKEYVRKNGTRWWGLFAATRIGPDEGVEYVIDVSEQKRADERLRQSEERLRRIVEGARDFAIFTLDVQNRITSWNPGAEALFGYLPAEVVGQDGEVIFTPEDRAAGIPRLEIDTAVRDGRAEDERWHVRKDGSRFWASGVLTTLLPESQDGGFLKVLRDLTAVRQAQEAHRQAEERFRLFVGSVQDYAIFLLDNEGRITSWNPGAQRIKGYTEAEVLGRHVSLFYPPEARAEGFPERELATALAEGRSENEGWRVRKGGERFWANEVMVLLPQDGPPTGFAKIARDLTGRRIAEQERERLLAEANAANAAKDRILATVSHELRTPLTPVQMGIFSLAREEQLSEVGREALAMIARNLELERQLIDDLLDVSRIVHGKLEVQLAPVDLHACVRSAVNVCQSALKAKELGLTVHFGASHSMVLGDEARLQQVFWNLLQNAAKFSPRGGTVTVRSVNVDARILVEVSDTGVGIEPDVLPRLFSVFEQGDPAVIGRHGGLGLGLTISRAVVEAHDGRIWAASAGQGQGATFTVELPVHNETDLTQGSGAERQG